MKMIRLRRVLVITVAFVLILATGCSQPSPEAASDISTAGASLSTEYSGALDVLSQLALGTLKLEETADAITEAQAVTLLPLWQTLQGGALQSADETAVVQKQIEKLLTDAQLSAIKTMQLTEEDAQTWAEEAGVDMVATGDFPGGGAGPSANMSDEDRASLGRTGAGPAGGPDAAADGGVRAPGGVTAAGSSRQLMLAVVRLLTERSGQAVAFARPQDAPEGRPGAEDGVDNAPVESPEAEPTATPEPIVTAAPEPVDEPTTAPTEIATTAIPTATEEVVAAATPEAGSGTEVSTATAVQVAVATTELVAQAAVEPAATAALVQVPDTNPGPPFSVEISLNRVAPSPLLDGLNIYTVSGLLRNDGDEVYAVNTVNFTFYDADGFRGAFFGFPQRRYGEWIDHGAMEANFDCLLLAPGEACPFTAEIAAYNMGSFYVHADAVVAEWREPAPVEVQNTHMVDQGSNVKISGTIVNPNTYAIKNVVVTGVLLDANSQITSMGSTYYVQSIAPGASVAFNTLVPMDTYVTYQVYVQAEGDFK